MTEAVQGYWGGNESADKHIRGIKVGIVEARIVRDDRSHHMMIGVDAGACCDGKWR